MTRHADPAARGSDRFTRQDIPRLAIAAGILILALTAILGADILPEAPLDGRRGPAGYPRHRRAARARLREPGPDRGGPRGGRGAFAGMIGF